MPNQQPITVPPAGYTLVDSPDGRQKGLWLGDTITLSDGTKIYRMNFFEFGYLISVMRAFVRDDDGNVVLNQAGIDADAARNNENGRTYASRIIPDIEHPEGGMTQYHNVWNPTSRKWELPIIESDVHAHHEREHDSDVASAVTEICGVEVHLMHRAATLANLNPDQTARAEAKYADMDACLDDIVDANIEPAIERAWLKSLGDVRHTGEYNPEAHYVAAAHDFATAAIALIGGKTTTQLRAHRYEYFLCLYDQLNADRGKTSNRFLPKGAVLVKTKSTPADAAEVTEAALFSKLRNLISPAEGPAKDAA